MRSFLKRSKTDIFVLPPILLDQPELPHRIVQNYNDAMVYIGQLNEPPVHAAGSQWHYILVQLHSNNFCYC